MYEVAEERLMRPTVVVPPEPTSVTYGGCRGCISSVKSALISRSPDEGMGSGSVTAADGRVSS